MHFLIAGTLHFGRNIYYWGVSYRCTVGTFFSIYYTLSPLVTLMCKWCWGWLNSEILAYWRFHCLRVPAAAVYGWFFTHGDRGVKLGLGISGFLDNPESLWGGVVPPASLLKGFTFCFGRSALFESIYFIKLYLLRVECYWLLVLCFNGETFSLGY